MRDMHKDLHNKLGEALKGHVLRSCRWCIWYMQYSVNGGRRDMCLIRMVMRIVPMFGVVCQWRPLERNVFVKF